MMARRTKREAWAATGLSHFWPHVHHLHHAQHGRHRACQFAVMRAVGLSRAQVAMVIAVEGILLALIGWGGGLLAGWGLLAAVSHSQSDLFRNGASLGTWCVVLTGLSAFGGALAASILPAWRAMSVEPLSHIAARSARPGLAWTASQGSPAGGRGQSILLYVASASMSSDVSMPSTWPSAARPYYRLLHCPAPFCWWRV